MGTRVADATVRPELCGARPSRCSTPTGIPVHRSRAPVAAPTRLVGLLDDTALIAVPNDFTKDIVETRLRDRVTATLSSQLGRDVRVAVTVDPARRRAPAGA